MNSTNSIIPLLEQVDDQNQISLTLSKLIETVEEIPFGNSDYQNQTVVVGSQLTPERAYRHAALRIQDRLQALNTCYYSMKESEVKIKKLTREIDRLNDNKPEDYDLDIELKEIEINKIKSTMPMTKKLIKDAIAEINSLSGVINSVGKLTKEQFEAGEVEHFRQIHDNVLNGRNDHVLALQSNPINLYQDILQNNILLGQPK